MKSMFFQCTSLEKVCFPASMIKIEDYAFADCEALREMPGWENSKITTIATAAFTNCKSLEEVFIPDTVTAIEGAAFSGCENISCVRWGSEPKIKFLGDHCFRACSKLTEIDIPSSVEYIGVSAFFECSNLRKVTLPECCMQQEGILQLQKENPNVCFSVIEECVNEEVRGQL